MDPKKLIRGSKFLSLVLRHKPEAAGIKLDEGGWADVNTLLAGCRGHGHDISREELAYIVLNNDKKRFVVEGERIRAAQGHSLEVKLRYEPTEPPAVLYHGTVGRFVPSIKEKGLLKGSRQHVHLSADMETAKTVGGRRGYPVVVSVRAGQMHRAGHRFFLSPNNVWLTDAVPPEFLLFG